MPTVTLTWTPAGGSATGQKIYRSSDGGNTYSAIATVSASATTYNDTTPVAGDVYFYKVATVCTGVETEGTADDICADAAITTPIALEGITYVDPPGTPAGFTQHFSNFTFSIGDLTVPAQHYGITKQPSTETVDRTAYTGGPTGSVTSYNYCTGGWCYGQALGDVISAANGVTAAYNAYDGETWQTQVKIYFDGILITTIQGGVDNGSGSGITYDAANPTGFGTQYLFLEPKGGSGFSLEVTLVPTV